MIRQTEVLMLEKENMLRDEDGSVAETMETSLIELSRHKLGLTTYTALSNAAVFLGFLVLHNIQINIGILVVVCILVIFAVAFLLSGPLLKLTNKLLALLPASNS